MAKRTATESHPLEKPKAQQAPKIEIDFESLVAMAIGGVVVKPAKKRKRLKSTGRP